MSETNNPVPSAAGAYIRLTPREIGLAGADYLRQFLNEGFEELFHPRHDIELVSLKQFSHFKTFDDGGWNQWIRSVFAARGISEVGKIGQAAPVPVTLPDGQLAEALVTNMQPTLFRSESGIFLSSATDGIRSFSEPTAMVIFSSFMFWDGFPNAIGTRELLSVLEDLLSGVAPAALSDVWADLIAH